MAALWFRGQPPPAREHLAVKAVPREYRVTEELCADSQPDTVTVSFSNLKPVANAGGNRAALVRQTVFLKLDHHLRRASSGLSADLGNARVAAAAAVERLHVRCEGCVSAECSGRQPGPDGLGPLRVTYHGRMISRPAGLSTGDFYRIGSGSMRAAGGIGWQLGERETGWPPVRTGAALRLSPCPAAGRWQGPCSTSRARRASTPRLSLRTRSVSARPRSFGRCGCALPKRWPLTSAGASGTPQSGAPSAAGRRRGDALANLRSQGTDALDSLLNAARAGARSAPTPGAGARTNAPGIGSLRMTRTGQPRPRTPPSACPTM